jgi:hypothetical protein
MATKGQVIADFHNLSPDEQREVATAVRALPDPSTKIAGALWIIIVSALVVVLIGGGLLLYILVNNGKSTEVILPLVTASLTALVGLLAPSPVTQGNR